MNKPGSHELLPLVLRPLINSSRFGKGLSLASLFSKNIPLACLVKLANGQHAIFSANMRGAVFAPFWEAEGNVIKIAVAMMTREKRMGDERTNDASWRITSSSLAKIQYERHKGA